jgi:hypothetical protein
MDFRRLLIGPDARNLPGLVKQGRPLCVVAGKRVSIGGVGEPVLSGARIVSEVSADSVDVLSPTGSASASL